MTCYCENKVEHIHTLHGPSEKLFYAELLVHSNACVSIAVCVILFALFDNGHCRKYDPEHTSVDDTNLPTADKQSNVPVR
jgi:hypothetical protein